MENEDDVLLTRFFDEQRQDIADDGFSRSVMQRLPKSTERPYVLWQAACLVAGIAVFFLSGGIAMLRTAFVNTTVNMVSRILSIDISGVSPLMVLAVLPVVCTVAVCVAAVCLTSDRRVLRA